MEKRRTVIENVPALIWGGRAEKVFLFVHGKLSSKDAAETFAEIADSRGYQTLSFDLPGHGERKDMPERCDVWNGTRDLQTVADFAFSTWKEVSLFACSLGAYFSLNALQDRQIQKCLFQSPIVDMEYLIHQMMAWFGISAVRLEREREIDTPIDVMTWDYYRYVMEHPIRGWRFPTHILYGRKDDLQSFEVINRFSLCSKAVLTVSENSGHAFMDEGDEAIVRDWMCASI